jgi:hypothetical protein
VDLESCDDFSPGLRHVEQPLLVRPAGVQPPPHLLLVWLLLWWCYLGLWLIFWLVMWFAAHGAVIFGPGCRCGAKLLHKTPNVSSGEVWLFLFVVAL